MTTLSNTLTPFRIDTVQLERGKIGMAMCPGHNHAGYLTDNQGRDLDADLAAIKAWGADVVITLLENEEIRELMVTQLGTKTASLGIFWLHLPIKPGKQPDEVFKMNWELYKELIHGCVLDGGAVLIHCDHGLGRTGVVAANLLIDLGMDISSAISIVCGTRSGAIDSLNQMEYLYHLQKPEARAA